MTITVSKVSKYAHGEEARAELVEALSEISEIVSKTMGPGGRPIGFNKLGPDMRSTYAFTKDGITVLKSLAFDNEVMQAVLHACKQSASHSVLASGDGTTSTIVLAAQVAKAINECGAKYPQAFARELLGDAERAIEAIRRESKKGDGVVRKVALTSSNGDEELTDVVLEAIKGSSALGTLLVEKNPATPIRYRISKQDGYSNCHGYNYNSVFAISASENAASAKPIEWDNPYVVTFNGSLYYANEELDQIEPITKAWTNLIAKGNMRSLVIVAYEASDEVCNKILVLNRKLSKYGVGCFIVRPRLTAEVNSAMQILRDIASYCGIQDDKILDGGNYRSIDDSFFGTCGKVKIMQTTSAFLGRSSNHWVDKRILQNQSIVEEARSEFDRQMTAIRNAEMAEGLVKVEVGGGMLSDIQERADRFDDASKAAQSCMEHGALPGSGCSYIRAGLLAGVHHSLASAFRSVHNTVLSNYGIDPNENFIPLPGMCVRISESGVETQNAYEDGGVLDSCETVCAVIKNGVELGVMIATAGGYSYRYNLENE